MEAWRNFNTGVWCDQIDVSNFIKMNYTPYDGDSSFLQGPTERTERTMKRVNELLIEENKKAHESVTTPNCRQKCAACGAARLNGGKCDAKR